MAISGTCVSMWRSLRSIHWGSTFTRRVSPASPVKNTIQLIWRTSSHTWLIIRSIRSMWLQLAMLTKRLYKMRFKNHRRAPIHRSIMQPMESKRMTRKINKALQKMGHRTHSWSLGVSSTNELSMKVRAMWPSPNGRWRLSRSTWRIWRRVAASLRTWISSNFSRESTILSWKQLSLRSLSCGTVLKCTFLTRTSSIHQVR